MRGKNVEEETPDAEEPTVTGEAAAAEEPGAAENAAEGEAAAEQTVSDAPLSEEEPASRQPEPTPIQEGIKASPGKIALAAAAAVVLIAALVALIVAGVNSGDSADTVSAQETAAQETTLAAEETAGTIPADGNADDVTCKGSYTVTDEEAIANRDTVVAVMGDKVMTNGDLQVYYWMEVQGFVSTYYAYAAYFGLDYTQPLDTQSSWEEGLTWQQYFLECALSNWNQIQAMAIEAENAGLSIDEEDQEYLDALEANMEDNASYYGLTLDELMLYNIGPGAGFEEFALYQKTYYEGEPYYAARTAAMVPTDEELEAFFAEHEEEYADSGITQEGNFVDVRHILIMVEGGTTDDSGSTTYSDEEWSACQEEAQAILDEWLAGEQTEESFAALANEKSEDGGSNTVGGLYENVYEGYMVEAFNDWCFDESRQPGDYGLVQTEYGYHVMYFVGSQPIWKYYAESDWVSEQTSLLMEEVVANHPMEVYYDQIALGYVDLSS